MAGGRMTDTRRRVKVYTLNEDRQWDDRGTGHVSSCYVERLKGMSLLVRAESDGKCVRLKVQSFLVLPRKGTACGFVCVALMFCCIIQIVFLKATRHSPGFTRARPSERNRRLPSSVSIVGTY